jgi:hypothetical protein
MGIGNGEMPAQRPVEKTAGKKTMGFLREIVH